MRRGLRSPLVVLLACLAIGGTSIYAFAGWTTITGTPVSLKVRVADMPAGNMPSVEQGKHSAVLRWAPDRIAAGVAVESYVVTRHGGGKSIDVCAVPKAACRDTQIPAGKWTWTVRPKFKHWIGEASPPTAVFTYVGDPSAIAKTADNPIVDPDTAAVVQSEPAITPTAPAKVAEPSATVTSPPAKEAPTPEASINEEPAPAGTSSATPTPSSAGEGGGGTTGEGETTVGAPAEAEKKLQ